MMRVTINNYNLFLSTKQHTTYNGGERERENERERETCIADTQIWDRIKTVPRLVQSERSPMRVQNPSLRPDFKMAIGCLVSKLLMIALVAIFVEIIWQIYHNYYFFFKI